MNTQPFLKLAEKQPEKPPRNALVPQEWCPAAATTPPAADRAMAS
jgi:hypothetical protein